jgi:AcrR family transcriptional regulator
MPRKYSMQVRSAAVAATRQRIVDATVELHNEMGVSGTSMQDIAERAGVALATVYRHFPSLDELVPACGGRNMELNPLPSDEVFGKLGSGNERVHALVEALFAHYERGQRAYEVGIAESATLPVMARLMAEGAARVRRLVCAATEPFRPNRKHLSIAVALCDFRVWRALTGAGLSTADAVQVTTQLITTALSTADRRGGGSGLQHPPT